MAIYLDRNNYSLHDCAAYETHVLFCHFFFVVVSLRASGGSIFLSVEESWRWSYIVTGRAVSRLYILRRRWTSHVKKLSDDTEELLVRQVRTRLLFEIARIRFEVKIYDVGQAPVKKGKYT